MQASWDLWSSWICFQSALPNMRFALWLSFSIQLHCICLFLVFGFVFPSTVLAYHNLLSSQHSTSMQACRNHHNRLSSQHVHCMFLLDLRLFAFAASMHGSHLTCPWRLHLYFLRKSSSVLAHLPALSASCCLYAHRWAVGFLPGLSALEVLTPPYNKKIKE